MKSSTGLALLTALTVLLMGCLSACASHPAPVTVQQPGTFSVDPLLREFYASLGGEDLLGPAITALFSLDNLQCQYTQNVLMCFDPLAQGIQRFSLYPLGRTFDLGEPASAVSTVGDENDYPVYEEFTALYQRLYGAQYAGEPLTPPRFNPNKNRIEQYFENVGFYRNLDDPQGEVYLLSYGVYACSADCRFSPPSSAIVIRNVVEMEQPFLPRLVRLGGLKVFGLPLTHPYLAADGFREQVYENVVLYAPPDNPNAVRLRPLARLAGMPVGQPMPRRYSEADGVVFFPLEGENGFHIPLVFDRFIASHGGIEISGVPLSEPYPIGENLYRQCFENYCLDYDNRPDATERVRMAALGREYLKINGLQAPQAAPFEMTAETVQMVVSAANPRLTAEEPQQFEVLLLRVYDQQPLSSVEATLTLTLPDGRQALYYFPPTDGQGRSLLRIAPLQPALPNGSVVAYRVCLNIPAGHPICKADSYLIWNYR
ncbi:MAG: hypothetical protein ACOYXO_12145 [Chloroflexota bacterium]